MAFTNQLRVHLIAFHVFLARPKSRKGRKYVPHVLWKHSATPQAQLCVSNAHAAGTRHIQEQRDASTAQQAKQVDCTDAKNASPEGTAGTKTTI
jgi:hypothetical protein